MIKALAPGRVMMADPFNPESHMKSAHFLFGIAAAAGLAACGHLERSQEPVALVRVGKNVAGNICVGCHDVSDEYRAPPPRLPGAPPAFITIAADPRLDIKHLTQFVRFPHGEMDNVMLTRRETDAVVAYILSLKRP